jgi:hypothetical protein
LGKKGKPVVYVVADSFIQDVNSAAEHNGMPGLCIVGIPADAYYKSRISREAIKSIAVGAFDGIMAALTRPLEFAETKPQGPSTNLSRLTPTIAFSAESYDGVLESFNQQFIDNHWGSGLPFIPPTRRQVKWLLAGTRRAPGEIVGRVAPKNGIAAVERIAINAVMAGAKPDYLPVIIAVMEAVTDKRFDLLHRTASTGSFSLQIMVNGPPGQRIGMNSGINGRGAESLSLRRLHSRPDGFTSCFPAFPILSILRRHETATMGF